MLHLIEDHYLTSFKIDAMILKGAKKVKYLHMHVSTAFFDDFPLFAIFLYLATVYVLLHFE